MQLPLPAALTERNPIMREEYRYQWATMLRARARTIWIIAAALLLIPALLSALAAFAGAVLRPPGIIPADFSLLPPETNTWLVLLMVTMALSMHVVLLLVLMALSSNSIIRERRGLTWEPLLLTGVDNRRLLLGKWWASVALMWGDFAMLAVIRIGLLSLLLSPVLPAVLAGSGGWRQAAYVLLGAGALLLYTLLDAAFTAALALLVTLLSPEGGTSLGVAMALRIVAAVVLTALNGFLLQALLLPSLALALLAPPLLLLTVLALLVLGLLRAGREIA